jgi:hypothetical protein
VSNGVEDVELHIFIVDIRAEARQPPYDITIVCPKRDAICVAKVAVDESITKNIITLRIIEWRRPMQRIEAEIICGPESGNGAAQLGLELPISDAEAISGVGALD